MGSQGRLVADPVVAIDGLEDEFPRIVVPDADGHGTGLRVAARLITRLIRGVAVVVVVVL